MKKALILLSITLLINPIFASVQLTLNNHLCYQRDIINLKIDASENYTGLATLRICLSNYDFSEGSYSSKCDTLLHEQEIYINNIYSENFPISTQNIPDSVYRFYLQLKFKQDGVTKTRQSCNDNNFILIKKYYQSNQNAQGIILSAQTTNESCSNETVEAAVTLSNHDSNDEILLYSFIKNQTHYINEDLDTESFKILNITLGSSSTIVMKNKIIENPKPGIYDYVIKAEANGKIYQTINTIEIVEKEIINDSIIIDCVCEEKECPTIIMETQSWNEFSQENIQPDNSKITAQLNLKRNEYYYLSTIIIGLTSLIIMYVKIK